MFMKNKGVKGFMNSVLSVSSVVSLLRATRGEKAEWPHEGSRKAGSRFSQKRTIG